MLEVTSFNSKLVVFSFSCLGYLYTYKPNKEYVSDTKLKASQPGWPNPRFVKFYIVAKLISNSLDNNNE